MTISPVSGVLRNQAERAGEKVAERLGESGAQLLREGGSDTVTLSSSATKPRGPIRRFFSFLKSLFRGKGSPADQYRALEEKINQLEAKEKLSFWEELKLARLLARQSSVAIKEAIATGRLQKSDLRKLNDEETVASVQKILAEVRDELRAGGASKAAQTAGDDVAQAGASRVAQAAADDVAQAGGDAAQAAG